MSETMAKRVAVGEDDAGWRAELYLSVQVRDALLDLAEKVRQATGVRPGASSLARGILPACLAVLAREDLAELRERMQGAGVREAQDTLESWIDELLTARLKPKRRTR